MPGPEAATRDAAAPVRYRLGAGGYGTHQALLDLIERGARLLDVGAAGGYLSDLAERRHGARALALDPNPAACAEARERGLAVVCGDIAGLLEAGALDERSPFDQILLADVLEHLPAPDAVLASLRRLLAPGGSVVVSLPNVAFARSRARILLGRFEYEPTGIFDATHLRFFTRASARRLLAGAGLAIVREVPIGPASYALGRRGLALTRLRPELLASQLVFLARPLHRTRSRESRE